jgi:hypothetical protein
MRIDGIVVIGSWSRIEASIDDCLTIKDSIQCVKAYGAQRIMSAAQKLQMIKSQRLI